MKIITVASLKGGVGKTSLSTFLSQALSTRGEKVLVIDADPNNNATDYFLREYDINDIEENNLYHFLKGGDPYDCIYNAQLSLDIIPCTLTLNKIGIEMFSKPAGMIKFKKSLQQLPYSYIIIDTPPSLSYEFRVSLNAADIVLSPVNFSRWTLQALELLKEELEEVESKATLKAVPSIVSDMENLKLRQLDFEFTEAFKFTEAFIRKSSQIKSANDKGGLLKQQSKSWNEFCSLAGEL